MDDEEEAKMEDTRGTGSDDGSSERWRFLELGKSE
jgi:hypothetical protein